MPRPRFYAPSLSAARIELDDREAVHAVRSRRLSVGQEVALFDGAGTEAIGLLSTVTRTTVVVAIESVMHRPRPTPSLALAVALPKGPRQDTLMEKCTELGVVALLPLLTERSVSSATEHKLERWQRTAIEAAKQSGQAWIPQFHSPELLKEALARRASFDQLVVASAQAPGGERFQPAGRVLAFIGPEGGWSPEEVAMLEGSGCRPLRLGPNTLRIETAAIALAALVHMAQGSP